MAHLYELQESETIRLIVGAQPLIPPTPDGLLKFKTSGIKEYKKFFFASVLAAWWFTRTVAVFDKEMVEELLATDQVDLQISVSQFARFLGNPVLIPFEKPYESGEFEILGCMIGFSMGNGLSISVRKEGKAIANNVFAVASKENNRRSEFLYRGTHASKRIIPRSHIQPFENF